MLMGHEWPDVLEIGEGAVFDLDAYEQICQA